MRRSVAEVVQAGWVKGRAGASGLACCGLQWRYGEDVGLLLPLGLSGVGMVFVDLCLSAGFGSPPSVAMVGWAADVGTFVSNSLLISGS